jgi:hypothetical protein
MARPFSPHTKKPALKYGTRSLGQLFKPLEDIFPNLDPLMSKGNKPLQFEFEHHIKSLVYFHLEEFTSARHLIQNLKEDDFAKSTIAPPDGIEKSSFSEANNNRGLDQFIDVFRRLYKKSHKVLPKEYSELGDLIAVDGSLIDAVLSMDWADYRDNAKKGKIHLGLDVNRSIPKKLFLTDGKANERPFVNQIVEPEETGILDRGYQCHKNFDLWQDERRHFVCRIKENTNITCIQSNKVPENSLIFYDALVLLGTPDINQTEKPLRLVGYSAGGSEYWVATDRHDLTAEQIALIYKLRWNIENFFAWWKRHMRIYHLIARSEHGLFVQILTGLITFLLLSIYCQEKHNEKLTIRRVRELRNMIKNESRHLILVDKLIDDKYGQEIEDYYLYAIT